MNPKGGLYVHYRPEGGLPRQIKQREATTADILATARTIEGAEEVETSSANVSGVELRIIYMGDLPAGRYLVVPLEGIGE
jgi:hypothetical protein